MRNNLEEQIFRSKKSLDEIVSLKDEINSAIKIVYKTLKNKKKNINLREWGLSSARPTSCCRISCKIKTKS